MWRSDKYAFGVAWLGGTSSIQAEVLHRSVGRTGAAGGIVGRGMERRSFALTWREVYATYPVTWLGCLHFHRMYGGLVGSADMSSSQPWKRVTARKKGSDILFPEQKLKGPERNGTHHNYT